MGHSVPQIQAEQFRKNITWHRAICCFPYRVCSLDEAQRNPGPFMTNNGIYPERRGAA